MQKLLTSIEDIAKKAGAEILKIYQTDDFNVQLKDDNSPLTKADIASHNIIVSELRKLTPKIPVLSEESKTISFEERSIWNEFWLVDPLDGTKEFVKQNDEFTVNIALIENGKPILGVVYLPVLDIIYSAALGLGAFRDGVAIRVKNNMSKEITILASKSHMSKQTQEILERIEKDYQVYIIAKGSALKLCFVADGQADFYPRLGSTMEWDTAAAQVVVEQAGGFVKNLKGEALIYNKENLLNPSFIVASAAFDKVWPIYLD